MKSGSSGIFQGSPCFGPWLPLGLVRFKYLGVFWGLEGSRVRGGRGWSKMMLERDLAGKLAIDTLV